MLVKLIISRLCVKSTLTKRKADHSDTFRIKMIGLIWWRRGESNPCPKAHPYILLRVQAVVKASRRRQTAAKPPRAVASLFNDDTEAAFVIVHR